MRYVIYTFCALAFIGVIVDVNKTDVDKIIESQLGDADPDQRKRAIKVLPKGSEFVGNTLIVFTRASSNNFSNRRDFAEQYQPKLIGRGMTCASLGIGYIQVLNAYTKRNLSTTICSN